jgi:hypothetical protein
MATLLDRFPRTIHMESYRQSVVPSVYSLVCVGYCWKGLWLWHSFIAVIVSCFPLCPLKGGSI